MILSSLWYHSGFLCVKFIADFRVIIMASFGCQISLCRWFTYWTVFLPTLGSPTDMYGGPWRINIYSISRSSSAAFSVSTIVTKTVLTSSSAASPSSAPDWVSLGCYTDMSDPQELDEECW